MIDPTFALRRVAMKRPNHRSLPLGLSRSLKQHKFRIGPELRAFQAAQQGWLHVAMAFGRNRVFLDSSERDTIRALQVKRRQGSNKLVFPSGRVLLSRSSVTGLVTIPRNVAPSYGNNKATELKSPPFDCYKHLNKRRAFWYDCQ